MGHSVVNSLERIVPRFEVHKIKIKKNDRRPDLGSRMQIGRKM